jgi:hypothetical protein
MFKIFQLILFDVMNIKSLRRLLFPTYLSVHQMKLLIPMTNCVCWRWKALKISVFAKVIFFIKYKSDNSSLKQFIYLTGLFFLSVGLENCKRGNSKDVDQIKRARLNLVGNVTGFINVGSSFNNIITWYYKKNLENIFNHSIFVNSIKSELIEILKSSSKPLKFNLKLEATYR